MPTVEIIDRAIEVRGLTRKEVRALEPEGYTVMGPMLNLANANRAVEKVFDLVLSREDIAFLETQPHIQTLKVWREINNETFGSKDEEKN